MKRAFFTVTVVFAFSILAAAQTTAFNFQGRLNDGSSPANGRYDLEFRLYDALTGDNIVGTAISKPNLMLVNGVFSTQLDFGAAAFSGADRFIEIRLRAAGSGNGFVILGPRQQILSVPYAIRSLRSTLADDATHAVNSDNAANATNATNATNAQTAVNSQQLNGSPSSHYVQVSDGVFLIFNGSTTSPVAFGGNVVQKENVNGLPKAILALNRDGNITNCYNGVTGASTNGCGFTVAHPTLGGYTVDFGFNVMQRAIVGTSGFDDGWTVLSINKGFTVQPNNNGITVAISYIHSNSEIWRDHVGDFTNAPFNIVVY